MTTLTTVVALIWAAIAVYYVYSTYRRYQAATGGAWQRLLSSAQGSATMLWSRFVAALAATVGVIGEAGNSIGLPQAQDYAEKLLGNPRYVAVAMIVFSAITALARRRTL